jgi:2-polyprenyl-6-methoxyphenol hydroxylase-like FAD-dependent oxidoreductase
VVGAGIAGLTLAGLLCRPGRPPVIIERSAAAGDGYAVGLYPLGRYVLHGLGSYSELRRDGGDAGSLLYFRAVRPFL